MNFALDRSACTDFAISSSREWLVTNGLGGFACGTVAGHATRRYHALLVAARRPPTDRRVALVKIDPAIEYRGRTHELGTNEYGDGTLHPRGYLALRGFELDCTLPTWRWAIDDVGLQCQVWMARERNVTCVRYTLLRASSPLTLSLTPLCAWRDYHAHQRGPTALASMPVPGGVEIGGADGTFRLWCPDGEFEARPDWYWNFLHSVESARGLDDREDLFCPGRFRVRLVPGASVTLVADADGAPLPDPCTLLNEVRAHERDVLARLPPGSGVERRRLALAADQFVVRRGRGPRAGTTLIAGYPWFSDWGRDTMIALPGVLLANGRHGAARDVLHTFARHVDRGMLPNHFPDDGGAPEYNTVDAGLWFFQAVHDCEQAAPDRGFVEALYPVLCGIVDWHDRGTRFGIAVDPADGLLRAGASGVQLTWMDARVGDRVVTPRTGKAVEINALWHGALAVLAGLAEQLRLWDDAQRWRRRADAVRTAFRQRFWCESAGHLYDVIDTEHGGCDAALRPNQLIACALPHDLLEQERTRRIVDACMAALSVPGAVRTLAPDAAEYVGRYAGPPWVRDAAYHQGTAWPWLLGPLVRAHLRAHEDPTAARELLDALLARLDEGCVGQLPEVVDGDAPYSLGGCFAQAWSVGEALVALHAIETFARGRDETLARLEFSA